MKQPAPIPAQHQFELPFSSGTVTLHSLGPLSVITLPAAATLNRAIQISCPKMASNYLFIGGWVWGVVCSSVEGLSDEKRPLSSAIAGNS